MPWKPKSHSQLQRAVNTKSYDASRPEDKLFYSGGHSQWAKLKRMVLSRQPLCACGCGRPSEVVDHVIPRKVRPDLSYSMENLQGLAKVCHDQKTRTEQQGTGRDIKVHKAGE